MKYLFFVICFLFMISLHSCTRKMIIEKEEGKLMISVIPQPVKTEILDGYFKFDKNIVITVRNTELKQSAEYLAEWIEKMAGYRLPVETQEGGKGSGNAIILSLDMAGKSKDDEAYTLQIKPEIIELKASNETGIFYAIQTLRQLLPAEYKARSAEKDQSWDIPCVLIKDNPRYSWRGMMLDVSRHFFPKEFIKDFIDYLAMYKLNTFHWHLVDDQGWRIEIKKYPRLTEVGAWRVDREDRHWNDRQPQQTGEEATYGGFYTQEDIR